jgi:hypothetical protein
MLRILFVRVCRPPNFRAVSEPLGLDRRAAI